MNQETAIETESDSYFLKVAEILQFENLKNVQVNMSNTYAKLVVQQEVKHVFSGFRYAFGKIDSERDEYSPSFKYKFEER